jgi:hypothetical protein
MSIVPTVAISDGAGALVAIMAIAIALTLGVIVGAALWIASILRRAS